jgi:hypothetical protein
MKVSLSIDSVKLGNVSFSIYEGIHRVYQGFVSAERIYHADYKSILDEIAEAVDASFGELAGSGRITTKFNLDELFEPSDQGFFDSVPTARTYTHIPDLTDERILLIKARCVNALRANGITYTEGNVDKMVKEIHNSHLSYRSTDYSKTPDVGAQISINEIVRLYEKMFG